MSHIAVRIHFVWSTAHRQPLIDETWQDRLYGYIGGILRERNATLLTAGGITDHIHVYASLPATIALAGLVKAMKAISSKWVHEEIKFTPFAWQDGYGAFSVSPADDARVRAYIANQKEHHKQRDFKAEYLDFLERAGVEYDPKYVFA